MSENYSRKDTIQFFEQTASMPVLDYIVDDKLSNFTPKVSSHLISEAYYCIEGEGNFLISNHNHRFKKGDFVLINPYVLHATSAAENERMRYFILGFRNVSFRPAEETNKAPLFYHLDQSRIPTYIQYLWQEVNLNRPQSKEVIQNLFSLLMIEISMSAIADNKPTKKAEKPELAASIANYLDKNFMKDISIDDLSKMFFFSKSTIIHTFSKTYGMGITSYLMERRLKEVKLHLRISNMPVNSIALDNGFSSIPYFYNYFVRNVGMTPSEYRKRAQEGKLIEDEQDTLTRKKRV